MVNSEQEAQQMQWPAMLPLIFSIFLATPVLQHPNTTMAFWLSIIPFFSPVLMFIRIAVDQPPLWQVALSVALMLVTIYGLLVFASRIYRVGILMYGKRPTLAELRRWLRYSG
jgi:ABC-2 type transport system permease protein